MAESAPKKHYPDNRLFFAVADPAEPGKPRTAYIGVPRAVWLKMIKDDHAFNINLRQAGIDLEIMVLGDETNDAVARKLADGVALAGNPQDWIRPGGGDDNG